ncbi:MAG TPA: hypothetical protein VJN63_04530 [Thermoplasmata archaeon]|nr:hypothetical protein [Thermoplasmata archaeon]
MADAFEAARAEHGRWRLREGRLLESLEEMEDERRRLEEELAKVDQQVAYYESLTRDMKKELGRPSLSGLLSSLRRP